MSDSVPGFRFYPTEEELISFYLKRRLENQGVGEDLMDLVIPVLNIYDFAPSELQQHSGVKCRGDPEQWFFFIPRQECESRGGRPSRLTESGYWKATGSPSYVYSSDSRVIGLKRTMVFYTGRAPQGNKTHWKMNEYKAIQGEVSSSSSNPTPMLRQEFSLCRVYKKTKCISAFDRRPIAAAAGMVETQANNNRMNLQIMDYNLQNDHDHDHAASTMRTPHQITTTPTPAAERTSSLDGSTAISSPEDGGGRAPQTFDGQHLAGEELFWLDWDLIYGVLNNRMMEEE